MSEVKNFFQEDPFLFKYCPDQVIRKCVPNEEIRDIMLMCHSRACRGHFLATKTALKILLSSLYWPRIFKDVYAFYKTCEKRKKK